MQTKSSGRLPTADCTIPVAAGPRWSPRWSVASPIRWAIPPSATADAAKTMSGVAAEKCSPPASATSAAMAAITVSSRRSMALPPFMVGRCRLAAAIATRRRRFLAAVAARAGG